MKNNKLSFLIFFGLLIIVLIIHGIKRLERDQTQTESVAELIKIKSAGKTYYVEFKYIINNEKYISENQMGFHKKGIIGDYYKIIYSSKNPKNVEIFLNEKITDTTLIKKAGFDYEK